MGTSGDKNARTVIRLLQHSILQLCNEHVGYSNKLQILGVLCMTIDDEPHEMVVKVNNTLKRVGPVTPAKEVTHQPGAALHPQLPVSHPTPITITPVAQNLSRQFQQGPPLSQQFPSTVASLSNGTVSALPFVISSANCTTSEAANLKARKVNMKNDSIIIEDDQNIEPMQEQEATSPERKSQGRKGRKPTKVHHVFDEGELISQGKDSDDEDVLTVIPTDPDHPEEDMEAIELVKTQKDTKNTSSASQAISTSETTPSNVSIMRQVLEQGADAAMAAVGGTTPVNPVGKKESPYRMTPYGSIPTTSTPSKPSGSASIRALLQAQAHFRQQMRLGQSPVKSISTGGFLSDVSPRSGTCSPVPSQIGINNLPIPITVEPDSPPIEMNVPNHENINGAATPTDASEDVEQEEALDFSNAEKHSSALGESGNLVIDERPGNVELGRVVDRSASCTPRSSIINLKDEPDEVLEMDENSRFSDGEDLSQAVALNGANLTSTPISVYNSSYTSYVVDGISSLPSYGLNLSLTNNSLSSPDSGLASQYSLNYGVNGQNLSNGTTKVKDIIMYDENAPLKQQKGNKVIQGQEGDYMLDKFGLDPKRRRRRSPDETLTAEEIAEYMGASSLATAATSGNSTLLFKCKYCNEEMNDLVRYLQHTLTVHNAYICHQCGKSFTTKSSLLRHRPIHTGLRRFACNICKKTFYRKDKCKSHIKRHLGPGEQNIDQYQQIEPVPEVNDLV